MSTKMAVAFANIFIAKVETEVLSQSDLNPLVWKRFINEFCLSGTSREEILQSMEQTNKHHPTIRFTAEISETEKSFLDTNVYKGERFREESVLDERTQFKPTETHMGLRRVQKGKLLILLRSLLILTVFEENITKTPNHTF